MPSATHIRTPRHARWLALCLVTVVLGAAPSGLIHYVVVAHTQCAEHGDIVHGEHERHGADAQTDHDGRNRLDRQAPTDDQHAHCSADLLARPEATLASAVSLAGVDLSSLAPRVTATEWRASQRQLHRSAPKQSPPV